MTCEECGGECCKGFAVPLMHEKQIYTIGVPIDLYRSKNDWHPEIYFSLHEGITISKDGRRFIVNEQTTTRQIVVGNETKLFIESRCIKLNKNGQCEIYESRPDMCKNFNETTLDEYIVPECCKYLGK